MYKQFEPFNELPKQNFLFYATRFEIWQNNKMINSGNTFTTIEAVVKEVDNISKVEVSINNDKMYSEIASTNIFDKFVTGRDRLQLITIPNKTNTDNMAIELLKMTIGATRDFKNFNNDEPYCCNLFIIENDIVKLTFSFACPDKLIEFYAD